MALIKNMKYSKLLNLNNVVIKMKNSLLKLFSGPRTLSPILMCVKVNHPNQFVTENSVTNCISHGFKIVKNISTKK